MSESFFGQQGVSDAAGDSNATQFQIRQELAQVRTSIPVEVIAVHGGGVGKPPTIDVRPTVNQVDGVGKQTPHGIIYGIPVVRSQGSSAAIINDPKVGDFGLMSVADRDISALKSNNGGQSNPGSKRRHNLADGIYLGSMLMAVTPDRYINLNGPGISLMDEFGNSLATGSNGIVLNGMLVDRDGNITTPGGVTAGSGTGDSITLQHHRHGGGPPPDPGT